jgi:hypothetical protein
MIKINYFSMKPVTIMLCLAVTALFWGCTEEEVIVDNVNYMALVDYGLMVMRKDLGKSTWSGACEMCEQLRLGGFTDWRLPAQGELAILYNERNAIGGFDTFNNTQYWSSTLYNIGGFYVCMNFTNGSLGNHLNMPNQQPLAVRCVRSTSPR